MLIVMVPAWETAMNDAPTLAARDAAGCPPRRNGLVDPRIVDREVLPIRWC